MACDFSLVEDMQRLPPHLVDGPASTMRKSMDWSADGNRCPRAIAIAVT